MSMIQYSKPSFVVAIVLGFFMFNMQITAQEKNAATTKLNLEEQKETVAAALDALKKHITGESTLEAETIEKHTQKIAANKDVIRLNEDVIKSCFDLVKTYDEEKDPLWIGYNELNNKKRKPGDEIHWAVFWVMQHLVDQVYTSEGLRMHGELLDDFRFGSADYFPGKVEPPANPEKVYTVKIDDSYPDTWGPPVFHEDRPARKPTGAYLVPGTIATVNVPESMVNQGYKVRVGAHSWDLSNKPRVKRLYRCTTLYDIDRREVEVANPLGGGIYI